MVQVWDAIAGVALPPRPVVIPSAPVVAPVLVAAPVITGSTKRGQTLTVSDGTWSSYEAVAIARQWRRVSPIGTSPSTNIGTGASTYVTVAADDDHGIVCDITATNSAGSTTATTVVSARVWNAFVVGACGPNDIGSPDDTTAYPAYGSPAAKLKADREYWLGARELIQRQFAHSGHFGEAGDIQWDHLAGSCIIKYTLARLQKWKERTGPYAAGQPVDPGDATKGNWAADPGGTKRRAMFVISPGFVSDPAGVDTTWFRTLNVSPTPTNYNDQTHLFIQQAWRWIAYGSKTATSGSLGAGGDGVFVNGVLDNTKTPTNQPSYCWTGTIDNYVRKMVRALYAYGLSDSIIQPWHEAAGGWYAWQWNDVAFIDAWRRMVAVARDEETTLGIAADQRLMFGWSYDDLSALTSNYFYIFARYVATGVMVQPTDVYPGDAYVDALTCDFYGEQADAGASTFAKMDKAKLFSEAHGGKLLINSEWGLDYDFTTLTAAPDANVATFVTAMAAKMATDKWYATTYFDTIAGGSTPTLNYRNYRLGPSVPPGIATSYPQGALAYQTAFGVPPVVGDPPPANDATGVTPTLAVFCNDSSPTPLKRYERHHNRIQAVKNAASGVAGSVDLQRLATLGVTYERVFMRAHDCCSAEGVYDFTAAGLARFNAFDSTLLEMRTRGVLPVICIYGVPTWNRSGSNPGRPYDVAAADYTKYKQMLIDIITHMKQQYPEWVYLESYNEPDLSATGFSQSTAWQFYDAFSDAVTYVNANVAQAVTTPIKLGGPVLKQGDLSWMRAFLGHVYAGGSGSKLLNFVSWHHYSGEYYSNDPTDFYNDVVSVRSALSEAFSVAVNATNGTWTLTLLGHTTSTLAYNISAVALSAAITAALGLVAPVKVTLQQSGNTLTYGVTFNTTAENASVGTVTTNASGLTGGSHTATPTVTAGYGGLYGSLPLFITEFDPDAGISNTAAPSRTILADEASWYLGIVKQMGLAGLDMAFTFSQSDYNNYTRSALVPARLDAGKFDMAAADGSVNPRYNVMRMMAMLPNTGIGSDSQFTTNGHGFATLASKSATQVGVLMWYHRRGGDGQPTLTPKLQINYLPTALRGVALKMRRYIVDEGNSNYAFSTSTQLLQSLSDVTGLGPFTTHATNIDVGVAWNLGTSGQYKAVLCLIEAA